MDGLLKEPRSGNVLETATNCHSISNFGDCSIGMKSITFRSDLFRSRS